FLIALLAGFQAIAQTARIKGVILDEERLPVPGINVTADGKTTATDESGYYQLTIPASKKVLVTFLHTTYKRISVVVELRPNEDYEFNPVATTSSEQIGEIVVSSGRNKRVQGITVIEPGVIRKIPGANAGVENILKSLPGVY